MWVTEPTSLHPADDFLSPLRRHFALCQAVNGKKRPNCFTGTTRPQQEAYQGSNRRRRGPTETDASLLLICVKWCHFLDQVVSHTVHKNARFAAVLPLRLHSFPLESLRDSQLSALAPTTEETDVPPFLPLPSP